MSTLPVAEVETKAAGESPGMSEAEKTAPENKDEGFKPFVGLVPLEEEHWKLLAGRDDEIKAITTNLRGARLTLLYGGSGVGKSSILRAGTVATLHRLCLEELNNFGAPSFAVVYANSWATDPFKHLAERIEEGVKRAMDVETLAPPPPVSKDLVGMLRTWTNIYGLELLIILDQFEEFFLYHKEEPAPGTFAHEFARAVMTTDLCVRFLLSLRDDSLYKLDSFRALLPGLFENRLQILPLTVKHARQGINKAIAAYNETQPVELRVEADEKVIDVVLDEVRIENVRQVGGIKGIAQMATPAQARTAAEPSAPAPELSDDDYIDAPYMQLVMSRIWDEEKTRWDKEVNQPRRLRLESLTKLGGAQSVVQKYLDKVLENFSSHAHDVASDCFYHLVTPSGTKYALTPAELNEYTNHPDSEIKALLEQLADSKYRIVRRIEKAGRDATTPTAAFEAHHDRIALAMLNWRARHEEKRRLHRTYTILTAIGSVVFVILIIIAVVSAYFYARSSNIVAEAQITKLTTEAAEEFVKRESLEKTVSTAVVAEDNDRGKLTFLKNVVPNFTCANNNARLRPDAEQINRTLEIDCTQYAQMITNTSEKELSPRIYIHVQSEEQKEAAGILKDFLRAQRYNGRRLLVPGLENVGKRNLPVSQLRYFHETHDEAVLAAHIAATLREKACIEVTPQFFKGYETSNAIRARHFELWLLPDALATPCISIDNPSD